MQNLTRDELQKRKTELQNALQQLADEYQRLLGAIQLCDTLIAEMDESQEEIIK